MPPSVVKTQEDERHWTEAKKQAAEQGRGGDYAYIMGIFKRMSGNKSLADRLSDLIKARPSAALPKGGKPIPKGMKFGAGGGKEKMQVPKRPAKDKPPKAAAGAVQGSVVKPPAGFTPIPHSKKGGYHKQMGAGKWMYWYPGQGIVGEAHEADAKATPHQEETAKHVMEQIEALEAKGTITREELQHTQAAIRNAWPAGPQDVPRHIMDHYKKLQEMVPGEAEKEEPAPKGKEEPKDKEPKEGKEDVPEVKIKRPGEAPMTTKELRDKMEGEKKEKAAKKEAAVAERAAKKEEKKKKERAAIITDPKKVPEDFNKLPKEERAKLTAHWDIVREQMDKDFPRANYLDHPDMHQAISEHIDELAEDGSIIPANAQKAKDMLIKQMEHGLAAGLTEKQLAPLLEENARKLAFQEVETDMRTLGDHGVRHLSVNAKSADAIFDELDKGGIKITPLQRFMAHQVMIDHDMGYTVPVIARGGFAIKDNYHPQASAVMARQQRAKYQKLFGKENMKTYLSAVETHSGSAVDWKGDPLGSAVRLADNTHLFHDKFPEVLFDTSEGVEVLTKIKLAGDLVPPSGTKIDERGNEVPTRTPEEKAKLKSLIGGIRQQLKDSLMARGDLPESSKKRLAKSIDEIGEMTVPFTIGRLAGRAPKYHYDKKTGDMACDIEQSDARRAIGEVFGNDQTDEQFHKLLGDYGAKPEDAKVDTPPPQAKVRIGEKGNGLNFTWRQGTQEHPNEQRYAKVMRETRGRMKEIEGMKGPAKRAALKQFFGAELQKAMDILAGKWAMRDGLEVLEKASAMSAMAARTGRSRPSAYAPIGEGRRKEPGMGIKERLKQAIGRRPPGTGWQPIAGGKKGGYRKMVGGRWSYWYPGMGEGGGSQKQAEAHQAKKDIAHHEKQAAKWQKKYSKRLDQGQHRSHVQSAMDQRDHHIKQAKQLRDKHGIKKSQAALDLERLIKSQEDTMRKSEKGMGAGAAQGPRDGRGTGPRDGRGGACPGRANKSEEEEEEEAKKGQVSPVPLPVGKGGEGNDTAKSVMVGKCQVHLSPDEALSKAIEDGEFGIGTVARTHSSKTMNRLKKGVVGGEGFTEHGADQRETVARAEQDAEILRMDPAGNCGNGGLPDWFADAQKTQEPMVRTPAVMNKAQQPATRVIDDDDPYTKRLHQADPRDTAAADINFAYNRDAKRTR